jgi:hypothetical protein
VHVQCLEKHAPDSNNFVLNIITQDESWLHSCNQKIKIPSMEWHRVTSEKVKKKCPLAGKVMGTLFWDNLLSYQLQTTD